MKSLEEFFSYVQYTFCGIPQIEMKGTLADWELLPKKIEELREIIRPLEQHGKFRVANKNNFFLFFAKIQVQKTKI